jgi:hypothetical protein
VVFDCGELVRALLIILLLHGLVPGLGEIVETVIHRMTTGHFAHTAGEPHDEGSDAGEHGCTPTAHRCHCCPSQPVLARLRTFFDGPSVVAVEIASARTQGASDGVSASVFRPPIG